jgi:hypothetical protein
MGVIKEPSHLFLPTMKPTVKPAMNPIWKSIQLIFQKITIYNYPIGEVD